MKKIISLLLVLVMAFSLAACGAAEAPAATEAPAPAEQKKPEGRRDIFAELGLADDDDKIKILKAKGSKNVTTGIVHISSTFNNTIVIGTRGQKIYGLKLS